ncbi:MAG: GGDEF domain-containing protein [Gammaproteobacteria bacterium]|nr:GGDEF domain-containing protein [Gammaproteobacteria bacterium]
MKLQLAILNIVIPLSTLIAIGFLPDSSFLLPDYVSTALIAFTFGRAFLLVQQQTVFSVLPMLILSLPESVGLGLNMAAPFALYFFLLYLWLVNLQWGQRPWLHPLHLMNFVVLGVFIALAKGWFKVPAAWVEFAYYPILWPSVLFALTPLLFLRFWGRIGRWSSYWPLLMIVAVGIKWSDDNYLYLWVALVSLFSLTLDSYVMSFVDELTGIMGRRALEFKLKTQGKHYFVAMVDVDHFKNFNDTYGHQVGDDVLKMIAKLISQTRGAKAYRYGGEEFCLVFNKQTQEEVRQALEDTRKRIADYALYPKSLVRKKSKRGQKSKQKALHITASFGVAQQHSGQNYEQVIERADKALYKAKQSGRNCCVFSK